jgi:hypothetical protein
VLRPYRHVAQAVGNGDAVEGIVGEGKAFRIDLRDVDIKGSAFVDNAIATHRKHRLVDIREYDLSPLHLRSVRSAG